MLGRSLARTSSPRSSAPDLDGTTAASSLIGGGAMLGCMFFAATSLAATARASSRETRAPTSVTMSAVTATLGGGASSHSSCSSQHSSPSPSPPPSPWSPTASSPASALADCAACAEVTTPASALLTSRLSIFGRLANIMYAAARSTRGLAPFLRTMLIAGVTRRCSRSCRMGVHIATSERMKPASCI